MTRLARQSERAQTEVETAAEHILRADTESAVLQVEPALALTLALPLPLILTLTLALTLAL